MILDRFLQKPIAVLRNSVLFRKSMYSLHRYGAFRTCDSPRNN